MLPVSGMLTDRLGTRTLVTAGMAAVVVGTLPLTRVTGTTADWQLIVTMVLRGLGFGAAMMPAIAGGYRNLPAAAAARASTGLSIFSRIGGTLGGAILAVILATHLAASSRTVVSGYDAAFLAALAIATAGFVAGFFLPGKPPRPADDPDRAGQPVSSGRVPR
jgi:MFS family permease